MFDVYVVGEKFIVGVDGWFLCWIICSWGKIDLIFVLDS